MTIEEMVQAIIDRAGGRENVLAATNCMTRLRLDLQDEAKADIEALKQVDGVLGIVHDKPNYIEVVVGPGKCRKCADICASMGIASVAGLDMSTKNDWQTNKANVKAAQKQNPIKSALKTVGEIFIPLIPGVIAAGLCAGISTLLQQLIPGYADSKFWSIVISFLGLINSGFLAYLTAWAGYRAAEKFGATPILGGMLGMITTLGGIDAISQAVGWFDEEVALNSILRSGRGGVLAALIGVWVLAKVERAIRKKMPESLDIVFTPLLSLIIIVVPYVFVVMPLTGLLSTLLCNGVGAICMSESIVVRIIAGFLSSALFLPMVAMGMHHGLVALYSVQLDTLGFVTLYPALAMAGAGQVGAAIAIYRKAKKCGNVRIADVIKGALPAGLLGVGEPLIYGVTLPMGKPFVTAGLGAGFGGAFVMAAQVAATTWGPSGLLALFVMTAGPNEGIMSVALYGIGLVISYIMGFVITNAAIKTEDVAQA
ncbi:MAG: PTS transporter subunit EIIC [Lachnospiraceae bacterium]|nr:PTS transporter subunit EIIC [Lachnospiraceae bacterium]